MAQVEGSGTDETGLFPAPGLKTRSYRFASIQNSLSSVLPRGFLADQRVHRDPPYEQLLLPKVHLTMRT